MPIKWGLVQSVLTYAKMSYDSACTSARPADEFRRPLEF